VAYGYSSGLAPGRLRPIPDTGFQISSAIKSEITAYYNFTMTVENSVPADGVLEIHFPPFNYDKGLGLGLGEF
jgi:hypothetical protein